MRDTILSAMWDATGADDEPSEDAAKAEGMRERLASGALIPAGNFRNADRSFWVEDEEK